VSRARILFLIPLLFVSLCPRGATAQVNSTVEAAANVQWGQKVLTFENGSNSQSWFRARVVGGRSYCVEAGNSESPYAEKFFGVGLVVYAGNQVTELASSGGDVQTEPLARGLARACWIPTLSEENYINLTPIALSPGVPVSSIVALRFVETTLFCPWFFIAGDYNAFTLIRNTTNTVAQGVVVTWRDPIGAPIATTTVSIHPNGTLILNARDFVNPSITSNGSVEIAHRGALDELKGSTTTISGSSGLSFDALFERRTPW